MTTITRLPSSVTPQWQRFQSASDSNPYQRQYSHVYHQRLAILGPRCGASKTVNRILELEENTLSTVVGTIVKEETETEMEIFLEDESGRVSLENHHDGTLLTELVTGVVAGIQGTVHEGVMKVQQIYFPTPTTPPKLSSSDHPSYVLLLSGIYCGDPAQSSISRDLLVSYIQGRMGHKAHQVSDVIIAGGLVNSTQPSTDNIREVDAFLLQMTNAGVNVHVIPGQHDPTTANWPQRPIHKALLKQTHKYYSKLLHCTPNPYACKINQAEFVGTDGYSIRELAQQLPNSSPMHALEKTLQWGHLCPNGPDRIPTVPLGEADPMVLTKSPHLLFAGNADTFATKMVNDCRLVCLPSFHTTGQAVLVNTASMDVEILKFESN